MHELSSSGSAVNAHAAADVSTRCCTSNSTILKPYYSELCAFATGTLCPSVRNVIVDVLRTKLVGARPGNAHGR
eukprot:19136-Heterococcus_DN1.PRE.1